MKAGARNERFAEHELNDAARAFDRAARQAFVAGHPRLAAKYQQRARATRKLVKRLRKRR
jgi:hypothetical protein